LLSFRDILICAQTDRHNLYTHTDTSTTGSSAMTRFYCWLHLAYKAPQRLLAMKIDGELLQKIFGNRQILL